jgi:large subunit ribosomal protein L4
VDVLSVSGAVKGQVELPESVFGHKAKPGIVWESVKCHLANQRQGNACTKTRAEVSGTGKKPYRQKHTGRARHGSRRSPIFTGGGIVFGPKPRDYSYELPKKVRRQALLVALSAKHEQDAVRVIEDFELAEPKTREVAKILNGLGFSGSTLLLVGQPSEYLKRAGRNLPNFTVKPAAQVSVYDVLYHDRVAFTESGLASLTGAVGAA